MIRFKIQLMNGQFYVTKRIEDLMGFRISTDSVIVPNNDIYHTYSEAQIEFLYNQYCDEFEKTIPNIKSL